MSYQGKADFRSDTVTRPSPAMIEAMTSAPLGDDVFGDDPTVRELEAYGASLFGKEAAVFVPSGTMANQIACRVHCARDSEVLLEAGSHVFLFEQGGLAQLSGLQVRTVAGERGQIDLERAAALVRRDDQHYPVTRLLVLENTHNAAGGAVLPLAYLDEARAFCDRHGLKMHLDGARIGNAAAASGTALADFAARADSISCCLSKGLGAPVGTLLLGSADFIRQARRVRKLFGGGMRQAGVIAAAGLVALRDGRERLVDDHRRARRLAEGFAARPEGFEVVTPETNLLYMRLPGRARAFQEACARRDVLALALDDDLIRMVTHKDIDDADVERALAVELEDRR